MPELPEVETTCRGIAPHVTGQTITSLTVNNSRLRWPVSDEIYDLATHKITAVTRRAKYLLLSCQGPVHNGTILIHLGMSGSLRVISPDAPLRKHDHILLRLENGLELRFHDPRRFGCFLWTEDSPASHKLISSLGPEPLSEAFSASSLAQCCQGKSSSIKQVIMDGKVVVGVGNIYACEALHQAGIHPTRAAGKVSQQRLSKLVAEIKQVLSAAIEQGGTTLRDFLREDGTAGYFKQSLHVYDRESAPCHRCQSPIKRIVLGQRSTFYCGKCQR